MQGTLRALEVIETIVLARIAVRILDAFKIFVQTDGNDKKKSFFQNNIVGRYN